MKEGERSEKKQTQSRRSPASLAAPSRLATRPWNRCPCALLHAAPPAAAPCSVEETPAAAARWARRTPASAHEATELEATEVGEDEEVGEVEEVEELELELAAVEEFLIAFSIVDADATTRPLLLSITWA